MEHRKSQSFLIELGLRYRTLDRGLPILTGSGKTINMSSSYVLFIPTQRLASTTHLVEVSIYWPVLLEGKSPLSLVLRGSILRQQDEQVVLKIQEHEFHLRRADLPGTQKTDTAA